MPSEPPVKTGRNLRIGKYQVITHLATGGMGAVYKALDVQLNREVALKVLPTAQSEDPRLYERFRREAVRGAKLHHENIACLYEAEEANGFFFLALEYVDGLDLHKYIARKKQLAFEESLALIVQAVRALGHLHEQGIVHRDIKPANFLVAHKDGRPILKLIDLGLARQVDDDSYRITQAGKTVGTIDYIAPEQARDCGTADIRCDIYSLGCTWYHMLAGRPPFAEGTVTERMVKHVQETPADIRQFNPAIPLQWVKVLNKMLAKVPAERYQTPAELLGDLEQPKDKPVLITDNLLDNLVQQESEVAAAPPGDSEEDYELVDETESAEPKRPRRPRPVSAGREPRKAREHSRAQRGGLSEINDLVFWGAVVAALLVVAAAIVVLLRP